MAPELSQDFHCPRHWTPWHILWMASKKLKCAFLLVILRIFWNIWQGYHK